MDGREQCIELEIKKNKQECMFTIQHEYIPDECDSKAELFMSDLWL